jgi:hypothetical protein
MANIQHCPISSQFGMWIDNDVPNWFPKLNNFYWLIGQCWIFAILWWPFWKWRLVEIFQFLELIQDIIIYPHIKFWWYRTMLNFCGIVSNSTLSDFNAISYVGRLWCPELIPDIEKFLLVTIFKMPTTISKKFNNQFGTS